jgi:hypothetical protein
MLMSGKEAPFELEFYSLRRAADDIAVLVTDILNENNIILGGHDWFVAFYL